MYSTRCAEAGIFECFHRWGKYVQRFGSVFIHWIITFQAYLGISVKRFASDVVGPKVREMDENESMDPSIIKGLFEQGVSYFARRISSGALWRLRLNYTPIAYGYRNQSRLRRRWRFIHIGYHCYWRTGQSWSLRFSDVRRTQHSLQYCD